MSGGVQPRGWGLGEEGKSNRHQAVPSQTREPLPVPNAKERQRQPRPGGSSLLWAPGVSWNQTPSPHSVRPQRSPTCNRGIRSLHPGLSASGGLAAIGLRRCPVSPFPSVSGLTRRLLVLVPPSARAEAPPRDVTRCRRAQGRASVSAPPRRWGRGSEGSRRERARGPTRRDAPPLPHGRREEGLEPGQRPCRQARGGGEARSQRMLPGSARPAVLLGARDGGRALGLPLRHVAAEPRRVAAGGAVDPARREGAHWPVRLRPGRQSSHGTAGLGNCEPRAQLSGETGRRTRGAGPGAEGGRCESEPRPGLRGLCSRFEGLARGQKVSPSHVAMETGTLRNREKV